MQKKSGSSTTKPPYVVKRTPAKFFTYRGEGVREMNWGRVTAANKVISNAHFYVHNRVPPPAVDPNTWQLEVSGSALRQPRSFSYEDLLAMPAVTIVSTLECGANGRRFFPKLAPAEAGSTWEPVSGSEWRFGAIGVARWTGVRLLDVLEAAGIDQSSAVDVAVTGLDEIGYSHVVPAGKACADDTLLVYAMNGRPLPPDHGYPCRVFFSGWGGNANVKWLGSIVVSATPIPLPHAQITQVLIGPDYPEPVVVTVQNVKSAFELDWDTTLTLPEDGVIELSGRAWSGAGPIALVEVCARQEVERGEWREVWDPPWLSAELDQPGLAETAWTRFTLRWQGAKVGYYKLMARATDAQGNVQPAPDEVPWNQHGLLYNGHVGHPVTLVPPGSGCMAAGD
ncbi:MAG: molybdopterin-dependent oxidoreductase [Chloroflexota bacterium]|nr:molybdopterin-dependent oxidoreductase [Chloroflexota bacterium]